MPPQAADGSWDSHPPDHQAAASSARFAGRLLYSPEPYSGPCPTRDFVMAAWADCQEHTSSPLNHVPVLRSELCLGRQMFADASICWSCCCVMSSVHSSLHFRNVVRLVWMKRSAAYRSAATMGVVSAIVAVFCSSRSQTAAFRRRPMHNRTAPASAVARRFLADFISAGQERADGQIDSSSNGWLDLCCPTPC